MTFRDEIFTIESFRIEQNYIFFSVIGGWANSKVLIRRKKSDNVLAEVNVNKVINEEKPTKIVIEVSNCTYI